MEDAAQEALVALLVLLEQGGSVRDAGAFVLEKAYWRARALDRANVRRRAREIRAAPRGPAEPSDGAFESLPDLLRGPLKEIVEWRLSGLTVREIAAQTKQSRSTVQRQLDVLRRSLTWTGKERGRKAG